MDSRLTDLFAPAGRRPCSASPIRPPFGTRGVGQAIDWPASVCPWPFPWLGAGFVFRFSFGLARGVAQVVTAVRRFGLPSELAACPGPVSASELVTVGQVLAAMPRDRFPRMYRRVCSASAVVAVGQAEACPARSGRSAPFCPPSRVYVLCLVVGVCQAMASGLPGDDEDPSPLVGGADLRRSEDTDRCLVTQALKVCADLVCSA